MGRLDGKVALVTGAGRGHGEAVAIRFAEEGAALAVCDILPVDELDGSVGERIRAAGAEALCFQTDVSKEEPVRQLVEQTIDRFGTIDILVNVVGIAGPTKDVWQMSLEEWQETLAVNLDSAFLGCKYALPEMIRKRHGRVINFSSGTGKQPLSHRAPYATSKMGILGFTRTLAADVGRYNITVNAICPGSHEERGVELERARAEYRGEPFDEEAVRKRYREPRPNAVLAGRWCGDEGFVEKGAGSEDAAAIAVFLASDDAASMTGQDINSGGWVMW
ncbi:MAG: SDR family NAD(P)-dependent oxidoreductase [Caldilineaceae bacterium]|nr:SDR family NAD(P)-dependent oxidoreductase [Caldilineaceae bacterium]